MKKYRHSRDFEDWDDDDWQEAAEPSPFDSFYEKGLITGQPQVVKSGKEATVYCCQGGPASPVKLVAVKVYLSRQDRNFKNDSMYQEGRVILDSHMRRAVKKKSRVGRSGQAFLWTSYEWETLQVLHRAGAAVPWPLATNGQAIAMEYYGKPGQPAPLLNQVDLEPEKAGLLFEQIMRNVELWLSLNIVHGDLSPYNILYHEGELKVIDFPQVVDPRFNGHAQMLLQRDIQNLCRYWNRYGQQADGQELAGRLWQRFRRSQL